MELADKYEPLFKGGTSRYYLLTGGRGSGKSHAVSVFALLLTYEKDQNVLYTRYTMSSAYTSIIPEFVNKLGELGLLDDFHVTKTEIENLRTGNKVYFRGIKTASGNQTASLKSLSRISCWICDEAEEIPDFDIYQKINLSVRSKFAKNRVILLMNPTTKEHWIYEHFFEKTGVKPGANTKYNLTTYIHTTYIDVLEHLNDSYLAEIEDIRRNHPKRFEVEVMGGWMSKAEGTIYNNWEIGKYVSQGIDIFGADFGFSDDPTALVKTSIDKKLKKIYIDECVYEKGLTTSEIGNRFFRHARKHLIIADSAEPRLIHELKSYVNIKPTIKGPDSVIYGIAAMLDYDLVISPRSLNIIKELNNYAWHDKKSQTPIDKHNHALDAARYAIASQIVNKNQGSYFLY